MDIRIEQALKFANYRFTLTNQKENLKFRVLESLHHPVNGGIFKVDTSLILYAKLLIDNGENSKVLIDNNGNPILIEDLKEFYETIFSMYHEILNEYYIEFTKLKKQRTVSQLTGVEEPSNDE